jgi:hypothetical protein
MNPVTVEVFRASHDGLDRRASLRKAPPGTASPGASPGIPGSGGNMSEEIQKATSVGQSPLVWVVRIAFVAAILGYGLFLMRSFGFL